MGDGGTGAAVELRLALVCYGGVSLAVYMHGMTKELHKLVRASRAFDRTSDLDAPNPFSAAAGPLATDGVDSEAAYFEALRDLARRGRRVSVVIDIVAGTSAGGINGVCLAKVLTRNGSQRRLRDVWVEEGDIQRLLRAPKLGSWKLQSALAGLGVLLRPLSRTSPLRGDRMSRLLYDALGEMDRPVDEDRTLLPPAGTLDLYVTATDLHGFEVLVPTGTGGVSQRDRAHAQVFEFRVEAGDDAQLGPDSTGALAFAARATSSFPGAFPAVSLPSFQQELVAGDATTGLRALLRRLQGARPQASSPRPLDPDAIARRFRHRYGESGRTATDAWLVDGGVLDNAPFDLAIEAIARKRAESEVVRRLVYIQPDPGRPLLPGSARPDPGRAEGGWLQDVFTAVVSVKGTHPILRELLDLRDLNLRIAQVGAITDAQREQVVAAVDELWAARPGGGPDGSRPWSLSSPDDLLALRDEMHVRARQQVGASFATYNRLKVEAAGRRLADEVAERLVYPPDSSGTSFVRAALGAWARRQDPWRDPDPARLLELLGPVDVPYRERRLLFLLAGVNEFYAASGTAGAEAPPRADLDELKREAWTLLEQLRSVPQAVVGDIPDEAVAFLSEADAYADPVRFALDHQDEFLVLFQRYRAALAGELGEGSHPLWLAFDRITASWPERHRKTLLSRYLGFPLWDALIFPTIALSELPQFTPIGVSQFSPYTAQAVPVPADQKLKGVTLHHFGGFLDAGWREHDYLWGRVDGAELVLRTLRDTARRHDDDQPVARPQGPEEAARAAGPHLKAALEAILDAEEGLTRVSGLRRQLRRHLAGLPGAEAPAPAGTDSPVLSG
jgi:patatin-related protein